MSETKSDLQWIVGFSATGASVTYCFLLMRDGSLAESSAFGYVTTFLSGPIFALLGLPTLTFRPERLVKRSAAVAGALFLIPLLWSNVGALVYAAFQSEPAQFLSEMIAMAIALMLGWLLIYKVWTYDPEPTPPPNNGEASSKASGGPGS